MQSKNLATQAGIGNHTSDAPYVLRSKPGVVCRISLLEQWGSSVTEAREEQLKAYPYTFNKDNRGKGDPIQTTVPLMSRVTNNLFIDALAAKGVKLNEDPYGGNVGIAFIPIRTQSHHQDDRLMAHGSALLALTVPRSGPGLMLPLPITSHTRKTPIST